MIAIRFDGNVTVGAGGVAGVVPPVVLPLPPVVPPLAPVVPPLAPVVPPLAPVVPPVLIVTVTPFVVVEVVFEDELTQEGQSIMIESPPVIRSICASLSGSAAEATPARNGRAATPKSNFFIDPPLSRAFIDWQVSLGSGGSPAR
jgi:hypothetical protein